MKKMVGIMATVLVMMGCSSKIDSGEEMNSFEVESAEVVAETGILTLRINPEVQIEYDKDGYVLSLTGQNDEGVEIASAYPDYIGKDVQTVLKGLIEKIHEKGYLEVDESGKSKDITLDLEPGSALPSSDFFGQTSKQLKEVIAELNQPNKDSKKITLDHAKNLALQLAKAKNRNETIISTKEFFDQANFIYQFEFLTDSIREYVDIDAASGRTLKHHIESISDETVTEIVRDTNETNEDNSKEVKQVVQVKKTEDKSAAQSEKPKEKKSEQLKVEAKKEEPKTEIKTKKYETKKEVPQKIVKNETKPAPVKKEEPKLMTLDQAKALALIHAGLAGQKVSYDDAELDYDDGVPIYEIEFEYGAYEYEVEVHGLTGAILDFEKDD